LRKEAFKRRYSELEEDANGTIARIFDQAGEDQAIKRVKQE
jgi:hypothetical protein